MKYSSLLIFLIPINLYSQEIVCLDTVTISGYFYKVNKWNLPFEKFISEEFGYSMFIPEDMVKAKGGLFNALLYRRYAEIAGNDTVGYCTYKPHEYIYEPDERIITSIQEGCKRLIAGCVTLKPFSIRNKFLSIQSISHPNSYKYPVIISHGTARWLKLKVKHRIATYAHIACGPQGSPSHYYEGFGKSSFLTIDSDKYEYFTIYVGLELLEINHDDPFQEEKQAPYITVILPKPVL